MPPTAVVTGGAGGIGGAIVRALVTDGWRVVVLDREEANMNARGHAAARHETRASEPIEPVGASEPIDFVGADLADTDSLATVAERIGPCDAFVHAAAAFDRFDLAGFDLPTWRRVQAVNVEAPLLLARAFTRGMAAARFGRIVLVTSNTVLQPPVPDLLPYIASKAALEGIVRTLAGELGPAGITVNAVAPGLTRTATAAEGMPQQAFESVRLRQAIPHTLEPDDIAGAVAFLASDRAAAITGQVICVDGGFVFR